LSEAEPAATPTSEPTVEPDPESADAPVEDAPVEEAAPEAPRAGDAFPVGWVVGGVGAVVLAALIATLLIRRARRA
jgi:hypothetical protein